MGWIETIGEDEWDGELADLYSEVVDRAHGRIDNIMGIHSLNPVGMAAHNALYRSAMAAQRMSLLNGPSSARPASTAQG